MSKNKTEKSLCWFFIEHDLTKNMDFGTAIMFLENGYKVKREHWGGYWFIESVLIYNEPSGEPTIIWAKLKEGGYAPAQPYQGDILAKDWEVVE